MPSNRLEVLITANAKQFSDTLKSVDRQVDDTVGTLSGKFGQASLALAGMSAAGGVAFKELIDGASQMEGFQAQLEAMYHNSDQAAAELQRLAGVAANTPFDLPGVIQASISLQNMELNAQKLLPVAGNLAILMRRDVSEGALIFGKAMKGTPEALQQIYDSGVITKEKLIELGAVMKSDGSIAREAGAGLEELQDALQKAIAQKGDVMSAQAATIQGAVSNLSDTVGQIKAELGKQEAVGFQGLVRGITDLLAGFQQLSPATKGMIADTLLVGTVTTGLLSIITGLIAILGPAAAAYVFYQSQVAKTAATQLAAAAAAQAAAVAEVEKTAAAQAAAVAELELATALQATAVGEAEAAAAAEICAAAEAQLAATGTAAAAAQAQLAATTGAAAAPVGLFGKAMTGLRGAAAGITIGLGPALLIIGAVAGACALYTANLSATTKELERQTQVEAHAIEQLHEKRNITISAAEAMKKYGDATKEAVDQVVADLKRKGQTDADVAKAQAGTMVELAQAEKEGNEEGVKRLNERLELLRKVRFAMSGMFQAQEAANAKAVAAEKAAAKAREAILADYQKKAQHGYFETNAAQLAALDKVLKVIGKNHKAAAELSLDRVKLAREVAEDEKKANKEAQAERLAQLEHEVDMIDTSTQGGLQKRLKGLKAILDAENLTADQRRALEKDVASTQQQIRQKAADAEKKASEEKKKRDKENADAKIKLHEAEMKQAEEATAAAAEAFREGKGTVAELEKQIQLRTQLAAKINLEKAAEEGRGKSTKAKADLLKAAESENTANATKAQREIDKVREEGAKRDKERAATKAGQAEEAAKREEANLRARSEAGENVETELKAKVKERQEAEKTALKDKEQAALVGANQADAERIVAEYERESYEMSLRHKEEQRAITEELKKQKAEKEQGKDKLNLNRGAYGIDQLVSDLQDQPEAEKPDLKLKRLDPFKTRQDQEAAKRESQDAVRDLGKGQSDQVVQLLKTISDKMDKPATVEVKGNATQSRSWNEKPPRAGGLSD